MGRASARLAEVRHALWHLRHGGVDQLRRHRGRRRLDSGPVPGRIRRGAHGLEVPPWPIPQTPSRRPSLRVGVVLDDFSRLRPRLRVGAGRRSRRHAGVSRWTDRVWTCCSSSPRGTATGTPGSTHLTGPSAPRPALVELVDWCREHGVPTVFWNKEDPVHYDDFLDTARLFDHVWTTDVERLDDYRRDLGHDRVGVLPFAAQPAVHNPVRPAPGSTRPATSPSPACTSRTSTPSGAPRWTCCSARGRARRPRMETGPGDLLPLPRRRRALPVPGAARVARGRARSTTRRCSRRTGRTRSSSTSTPSSEPEHVRAAHLRDHGLRHAGRLDAEPVRSSTSSPPTRCSRSTPPEEAEWTLRALVNSPELRDRMVHGAQRRIWASTPTGTGSTRCSSAAGLGEHRSHGARP